MISSVVNQNLGKVWAAAMSRISHLSHFSKTSWHWWGHLQLAWEGRLPAADVGGGGEEGEDEDDGVEEVPAVHHKLCFALRCIINFASIILIWMLPALLNIALGVADKVVVQIDEPSEKLCPSSVWVYLVCGPCQIQDGWKGKGVVLWDKDDEGGDVSLGQGNATVAKGQVSETKHCVLQRWKTLMEDQIYPTRPQSLPRSTTCQFPRPHRRPPQRSPSSGAPWHFSVFKIGSFQFWIGIVPMWTSMTVVQTPSRNL